MTNPAQSPDEQTAAIVNAALSHVPFDGWSAATLRAATADAGVDPGQAAVLFPRGAVDLALAFHQRGDHLMAARIGAQDLTGLRFRDRITLAVRTRIEVSEDREVVRRGTTFFALPIHAAEGARAIWNTTDLIWTLLGDTSDDINWYTKRATLSAVYSATVLYWLGDESQGAVATWAFLDRRIEDVMRIEQAKATMRKNPLLRGLFAGPNWLASRVRAPKANPDVPLPGRWAAPHPAAPEGDHS